MERLAITIGCLLLAGCSLFGPRYEIGDVDMDGSITKADAELVLASIAACGGICSTLEGKQRRLADANGDGEITPGDASIILAWAAGDLPHGEIRINNEE